MEASPEEQLKEYESQLTDINGLLQASPGDPSLLQLKSDLVELIKITKESLVSSETAISGVSTVPPVEAGPPGESGAAAVQLDDIPISTIVGGKRSNAPTVAADGHPPPKKSKKIKEFEIPAHLLPLDTDTDKEKEKKRRAIKSLKNKFRERKKEVESEKKQKSWQSFQKKKGKKVKDKSMFSTQDGDAKVGVVSVSGGRKQTQFADRKRHTH